MNDYPLLAGDICSRYQLQVRITSVSRVLRARWVNPGWVYGTHRGTGDFWPMTRLRNDLDSLLHAVSALRVGSQAGDEPYESCGSDSQIVAGILQHPRISEYYLHHYGVPNAALVVAEANGIVANLLGQADAEPRDEEWLTLYLRFLTLDAQVGANQPLRRVLNLVDSGVVDGVSLTDLESLLGDPKEVSRWLHSAPHAEVLEGLQDLLDFAEELHALLSNMKSRPVMRGLAWLHFAHWLVHRRDRLIGITEWAIEIDNRAALAEAWLEAPATSANMPGEDRFARAAALRQMIAELTDPAWFPSGLFHVAGPALKEWLSYVAWRHWHHPVITAPMLTL